MEFLHGLGACVPGVLGRWATPRGSGVLLTDVPGDDHYGAPARVVTAVADQLIDILATCASRLGELDALGVPDACDDVLADRAEALLERIAPELSARDQAAAERFVAQLPAILAAVAGCGLPVTLVHGDAHPATRGPHRALTLLDWGDSQVGRPARDLAHLVAHLPANDAGHVLAVAADRWRLAVPRSDARTRSQPGRTD